MIVLVDDRDIVRDGYEAGFEKAGVSIATFVTDDFRDWIETAPEDDLSEIEAFLLGDCDFKESFARTIRNRATYPLIAVNDTSSLEQTLKLFEAGVDDVVKKPVHIREILARIAAIVSRRRISPKADDCVVIGNLKVFMDGRPPEIDGEVLPLPRREQRILQRLAQDTRKRVTKTQLYNYVYGLFNEEVAECVIESHVSKLRKKLRNRLGYDPICSKRYLGYCLNAAAA